MLTVISVLKTLNIHLVGVLESSWHLHHHPYNWKRPPGRPRIKWLNTIQRDLRAYNLTLNEAVNLAQNRPPWRLMSMCGVLCTASGACQKRRRMIISIATIYSFCRCHSLTLLFFVLQLFDVLRKPSSC